VLPGAMLEIEFIAAKKVGTMKKEEVTLLFSEKTKKGGSCDPPFLLAFRPS